MYVAIIGDIIHSKSIPDRRNIQIQLKDVLDQINTEFNQEVSAKFIITLGDEFQGLLSSASNILQIIDRIQFEMFPVRIRFGIGIGNIETEIIKDMAIGADGPAYHYAREMMNYIKICERGKMFGSTNIMLKADAHLDLITLINSSLQLCSYLERNWTDKQRTLLKLIILENKNQKEAAIELGIEQSSVQRRLKAAGYYDYISVKSSIKDILKENWGELGGK